MSRMPVFRAVTAEIDVPARGGAGVIVSETGPGGGWSLSVQRRRLRYWRSLADGTTHVVLANRLLAPGTHQVRAELVDGATWRDADALVTLFIDGVDVGAGRIERTAVQRGLYGLDHDQTGEVFDGSVRWVQIDRGADGVDHFLPAAAGSPLAVAARRTRGARPDRHTGVGSRSP